MTTLSSEPIFDPSDAGEISRLERRDGHDNAYGVDEADSYASEWGYADNPDIAAAELRGYIQ
jgi:hypothetical protein